MKSFLSVLLFSIFIAASAKAQSQNPIILKHYNLEKKLALEGYDPVSYFQGSKPLKGKSSIQASSDGATYYFSSSKNKALFQETSAKYKPEYGGWCAYAMGANGEKVEVNPATFKIINGKLYLFYNAFFNNTLTDWNKDETSLKAKADKNWKSIFK